MDGMKKAMDSVLEGMGRAAREGRARRFTKRPVKGVDVTMGDVTLEPNAGMHDGMNDVEVDPVKEDSISDADVDDLAKELAVQR